jgi:hypothetical protein
VKAIRYVTTIHVSHARDDLFDKHERIPGDVIRQRLAQELADKITDFMSERYNDSARMTVTEVTLQLLTATPLNGHSRPVTIGSALEAKP